jgi:YVTN family beta-propeller protein
MIRPSLLALSLFLGTAIAHAEPFAYVTNAFGPSVTVIDTATRQVVATVAFPAGSAPYSVAIAPDLKKVYVTSMDTLSTCGANAGVYVIDVATNALGSANFALGSGHIAAGCEPTGIAITPDGMHVYVANQFDDTISVIDTNAGTVSTTISLPRGTTLANIAIAPDGKHAYASAQGPSAVIVVDTATNTAVGAPIVVGGAPLGLAVSPDGAQVYVANNDNLGSVSVIDTASDAVVNTFSGLSYPFAVTFSPDGKLAYVTGGGSAFLAIIDTASQTVLNTLTTVAGTSIAVTADGTQAYVSNENGNTVTVVDTASAMPVATIDGLNSPRGVAARPLPPGVLVPNVTGDTQAAATAALTAAALTTGNISQQASTTVAPGSIISQSPAAGTLVASGTPVALVASTGVAVPDTVGKSQASASSAITAAGLAVGSVTQQLSGSVAAGNVISQDPAAGASVAGGTAVNLVVSSGNSGGGGGGGGGGGMDPLTLAIWLSALAMARRPRRRWTRHQAASRPAVDL